MSDTSIDEIRQLSVLFEMTRVSSASYIDGGLGRAHVKIAIRVSRPLNDQHDIGIVESVGRNGAAVVRAGSGSKSNGRESAGLKGVEGDVRLR